MSHRHLGIAAFLSRTCAALALVLILAGPVRANPWTRLHSDASEASVRADGALAWIARVDGRAELAWSPVAGPRHVLAVAGSPDTPAWSPDGTRLAVSVERDGNADLVIVDVATGDVRVVVQSPDPDLHPTWSADGQRLLYTRLVRDEGGAQVLRLFERDLRPGGADVPRLSGAQASYGAWSPDGQWLLFWHLTPTGDADIAIARGDGSELRNLTTHVAFDAWPAWSPDGRHVAFARERGVDADILVIGVDGGKECLVAAGAGRKTSPKWTPDGRSLVFDLRRDGHVDLMRVAVAAACLGEGARATTP